MKELIECLDLSYHELRYVYKGQADNVSGVILNNLPDDWKTIYRRNSLLQYKLTSVLVYALKHGKSVMAYAEGRKKLSKMPKIYNRKLNSTDLELLVGLHNAANLGQSLYEK